MLSRLAANLENNFNYQRGGQTSCTMWLIDALRQSYYASLVDFARQENKSPQKNPCVKTLKVFDDAEHRQIL